MCKKFINKFLQDYPTIDTLLSTLLILIVAFIGALFSLFIIDDGTRRNAIMLSIAIAFVLLYFLIFLKRKNIETTDKEKDHYALPHQIWGGIQDIVKKIEKMEKRNKRKFRYMSEKEFKEYMKKNLSKK